jgi:hypothetical protein
MYMLGTKNLYLRRIIFSFVYALRLEYFSYIMYEKMHFV